MASSPRDLASRMAGRRKSDDGYLRETFKLPREKAELPERAMDDAYDDVATLDGMQFVPE